MKSFLALWFSDYCWARKYVGGKWVAASDRSDRHLMPWVRWNDPEDIEYGGWPLSNDFVCEDWGPL